MQIYEKTHNYNKKVIARVSLELHREGLTIKLIIMNG
jgi:hypothetical protein